MRSVLLVIVLCLAGLNAAASCEYVVGEIDARLKNYDYDAQRVAQAEQAKQAMAFACAQKTTDLIRALEACTRGRCTHLQLANTFTRTFRNIPFMTGPSKSPSVEGYASVGGKLISARSLPVNMLG